MNASWDGGVSSIYGSLNVILNLIFDLVFRIIIAGAYLLYYLRYESLWCENASWNGGPVSFLIIVTLTSDLVSRIGIKSGA